jgi:hydrogenase expression/formation protein
MDLEGLTKKMLKSGKSDDEIIQRLVLEYSVYKQLDPFILEQMARAILEESKRSSISEKNLNNHPILSDILLTTDSKVSMGEFGVGCRGYGDFFVHKLITSLSKTAIKPILAPESLDDCGAVSLPNQQNEMIIVSKMEGMHSRLSDFPFLAAFHVTRAALRDLLVKGAIPISVMVDIHLGDDADISKLFDFTAGVATVAEIAEVPITAGSTLRIGGDMVIGDRITGGIAAVGIAKKLFLRRDIKKGDAILMTEGAGGGTISTTALYTGSYETALETININFLKIAKKILSMDNTVLDKIHCMSDVTNGGLRGDLREISEESKLGAHVEEIKIRELVNPKVLALLKEKNIDYLGVSLDALLIFCDPIVKEKIIQLGKATNIKINEIGTITEDPKIKITTEQNTEEFIPHFRESAYTKIKQIIGEQTPDDLKRMEQRLEESYRNSLEKKNRIVAFLKNKQ